MSVREVTDYKRRLDNVFDQYKSIPADEFELKAHMARYLCILISGFIEVSVRAIYTDYSRRKSSPYVGNYVDAKLSSLRNVHMEKLLDLTRSFSPVWEAALRTATEGELADAVNSVVTLRNQIAHGKNAGISFHNVRGYYERVLKVVDIIEAQCT